MRLILDDLIDPDFPDCAEADILKAMARYLLPSADAPEGNKLDFDLMVRAMLRMFVAAEQVPAEEAIRSLVGLVCHGLGKMGQSEFTQYCHITLKGKDERIKSQTFWKVNMEALDVDEKQSETINKLVETIEALDDPTIADVEKILNELQPPGWKNSQEKLH